MLRLNRTFKVVLPLLLVTTVPTAYPQSAPAKVKVGDVEYSVTPMSRGRMLRIDDLAGHMIGMASVNGANVSVLAPQQEPGFSGVRNAATEYLHPTNGGATAPANTPPPRLPRLRPWMILTPVSYTHLDVYKRQQLADSSASSGEAKKGGSKRTSKTKPSGKSKRS